MTKSRQTSHMKPGEAKNLEQHRDDDQSDHGLDRPNRGADRIPVGLQRQLQGVERYISPGFHGYGFLEKRVQGALQGGYEFCKDEKGNNVTRTSGEERLIFMQIPEEMWKADQKLKHKAAIDAMAQAAKIDDNSNQYSGTDSGKSVEVTGTGSDPLFN